MITYQCLAGLSLYLGLSSSGTGERCCFASASAMVSSCPSGGGTWSQAFWLQTSASSVRNLGYRTRKSMIEAIEWEGRRMDVQTLHQTEVSQRSRHAPTMQLEMPLAKIHLDPSWNVFKEFWGKDTVWFQSRLGIKWTPTLQVGSN